MLSDSRASAAPAERRNVGFENLAKTIGARWRNASDEERAPYKEKAAVSFFTWYRLQCALMNSMVAYSSNSLYP